MVFSPYLGISFSPGLLPAVTGFPRQRFHVLLYSEHSVRLQRGQCREEEVPAYRLDVLPDSCLCHVGQLELLRVLWFLSFRMLLTRRELSCPRFFHLFECQDAFSWSHFGFF